MNVIASNPASNGALRVSKAESKHDKFLRLADARVTRALDDIRLVGQLSARTYEHKAGEVEIIVKTLADAVSEVAKTFTVPFAMKVGKAGKADVTAPSIFEETKPKTLQETNKVKLTVAKALDLLKQGESAAAQALLADLL